MLSELDKEWPSINYTVKLISTGIHPTFKIYLQFKWFCVCMCIIDFYTNKILSFLVIKKLYIPKLKFIVCFINVISEKRKSNIKDSKERKFKSNFFWNWILNFQSCIFILQLKVFNLQPITSYRQHFMQITLFYQAFIRINERRIALDQK